MQLLCMRSCTLNCFVAFCRSARTSLGHSVLCCAMLRCGMLCCAVLLPLAVPLRFEYKAVTGLGKSALTRLYRTHSQPQIKLKKKKKHVV